MSKLITTCLAVGLLAAPALDAQIRSRSQAAAARFIQPDFFPLAVGNSWIYESEGRFGGDQRTIRVTEQVNIRGVSYYRVEGLELEPALLRVTARGRLMEHDPSGDRLWYDFAAPVGGSWNPERSLDCLGAATLANRGNPAVTPAGSFRGAATIEYGPTNCADAGLSQELFAPGVGLVQQTEITIAGPRVYSLVRARVGGRDIRGSGVSFSLKVDRASYTPNLFPPVDPERSVPTLTAELTIENSTDEELVIRFPSGQQYDLSITNEAGEVVYFWSANKLFTQATTMIELTRDSRTFVIKAPLGVNFERPLPAGTYLVEAWLTTAGARIYAASLPIRVTEPVF